MERASASSNLAVVRNLIGALILLQGHLRLYAANNASIELATSRVFDLLSTLLRDTGGALTLHVVRHGFLYGDGFIDRANPHFEKFAGQMFQHGIAAVTFSAAVSPEEVRAFLRLVARRPAETWDEGGVEACMQLRSIAGLTVREMAAHDFRLTERVSGVDSLVPQRSVLWENFATAALQGLTLANDTIDRAALAPQALAAAVNRQMQSDPASETGSLLGRITSRFLISLRNETVRPYRSAAIRDLALFVNSLSTELRSQFFDEAFALNLDEKLSEELLSRLTDQSLVDAVRRAAAGSNYTPPFVIELLGRLAQERHLILPADTLPDEPGARESSSRAEQLQDLLRPDELEKYVPKEYQNALLAILHQNSLTLETTTGLETLKATLEPAAIDQHVGDILMEVLRQASEGESCEELGATIIATLEHYLSERNYPAIDELLQRCRVDFSARKPAEVCAYLATGEFARVVVEEACIPESGAAEAPRSLIIKWQDPFVVPLLDRLGVESNRTVRQNCLRLLQNLGSKSIVPAAERLSDQRWFVVRNMLFLLREVGDPAALPFMRPLLRHPHPKVRQEALRSCLLFGDPGAVTELLDALSADEEGALLRAVTLASLCGDVRVVSRLVELLTSGRVFDFRLDIKRAAVRSLAVSAPAESLRVFAEILRTRSLFHPQQQTSLKLEILSALEKFPVAEVAGLLEEQRQSASPEIARAAQRALNKTGGGVS